MVQMGTTMDSQNWFQQAGCVVVGDVGAFFCVTDERRSKSRIEFRRELWRCLGGWLRRGGCTLRSERLRVITCLHKHEFTMLLFVVGLLANSVRDDAFIKDCSIDEAAVLLHYPPAASLRQARESTRDRSLLAPACHFVRVKQFPTESTVVSAGSEGMERFGAVKTRFSCSSVIHKEGVVMIVGGGRRDSCVGDRTLIFDFLFHLLPFWSRVKIREDLVICNFGPCFLWWGIHV